MSIGCVIAAGASKDKQDPISTYLSVPCKAMAKIDNREMIEYVIQAIQETERIKTAVVVGCKELDRTTKFYSIARVESSGGMLDSFIAGCQYIIQNYPDIDRIVISMADIPLIEKKHLNWFINECEKTDHDFYWAIISKKVMTAMFPDSKRTYAHTLEGHFCSGDLFLVKTSAIKVFMSHYDYWAWAIRNRKKVWPMLWKFNLFTWLRFLFGLESLNGIENALGKVIGIRFKAVVSPFAEHGMDVDKPFQLEIVKNKLNH